MPGVTFGYSTGTVVTAAQWTALFAQCFPAGNISAYSQTLLSGASQGSWFTALGLPAPAPGTANGLALLDASIKIPLANMPPSIVGALYPQGGWNASTNNPALVSSVGTKGLFYTVTTAGSTTLDGNSSWLIGDSVYFDGTIWRKIASGAVGATGPAGPAGGAGPPGPAGNAGSMAGASGRLTLVSATPVMRSSAAGAATIYLTPFLGDRAPIWNGVDWASLQFTELSQALSDTTKSPLAADVNQLYDMFQWSDGGTLRISRGPPWSAGGGSNTARGTGAGSTQLQTVNGFFSNNFDITNGPLAGYGLYRGTIATNGSATVDYIFGAAASGGAAATLNVWNNFNRVVTQTQVVDNGATYLYSSTVRAARASTTNRISFISGVAEDAIITTYFGQTLVAATTGSESIIGVGLDTTSAYYGPVGSVYTDVNVTARGYMTVVTSLPPQIGQHYVQALESSTAGNNIYNYRLQNALQMVITN